MWDDLLKISKQMKEAWCIMGDFNAILCKEDRRGRDMTQYKEIKEMADFMETGDLQEMRWCGAYYSWTNKTIWSRIDWAFINIHGYEVFDFTQNQYLAKGLFDHSPMLVHFRTSSKPRSRFQSYEMWCKPQNFTKIVNSAVSPIPNSPPRQLRAVLANLRVKFSKLNRDNFTDLRAQNEKARKDLTTLQMKVQNNPGDTTLC